jgi:hypothetical protein
MNEQQNKQSPLFLVKFDQKNSQKFTQIRDFLFRHLLRFYAPDLGWRPAEKNLPFFIHMRLLSSAKISMDKSGSEEDCCCVAIQVPDFRLLKLFVVDRRFRELDGRHICTILIVFILNHSTSEVSERSKRM